MSNVPAELKYIASHEWLRLEDDGTVTVGITDHAQDLLGDVVFVELPDVGDTIAVDDEISVVESVKAAYDLYAPVSGEIIEINEELEYTPELVNEDPYNQGWMIKIRMDDSNELDNLLSAEDYFTHIESKEMGE